MKKMANRISAYNETLAFLRKKSGRDGSSSSARRKRCWWDEIEKNREKLDALYQIGLEDARNAMADMKAYLEKMTDMYRCITHFLLK